MKFYSFTWWFALKRIVIQRNIVLFSFFFFFCCEPHQFLISFFAIIFMLIWFVSTEKNKISMSLIVAGKCAHLHTYTVSTILICALIEMVYRESKWNCIELNKYRYGKIVLLEWMRKAIIMCKPQGRKWKRVWIEKQYKTKRYKHNDSSFD